MSQRPPRPPVQSRQPRLDDAYALRTPEDNIRLYRTWAETYDDGFAGPQGYRLPALVAETFAACGGAGPVLDIGAGTGLVGERLASLGIGPVDGVDISVEMLARAAEKRVYRSLFCADFRLGLDERRLSYGGITSSGAFTLGHLGPEAMAPALDLAAPGALVVLSVNRAHYDAAGFAEAFMRLAGRITPPELTEVAIYGAQADPSHRDDRAFIAVFRVSQAQAGS